MAKAKVREKYRGLSRQELIDKAYELSIAFEKNSYCCSQAPVAALHELLEFDDVVVKVSTSLSGGTAEQFSGTCGPLVGGLIVLGYFFGRPVEKLSATERKQSNVDTLFETFPAPQALVEKYWQEYGTILCRRHCGALGDGDSARKGRCRGLARVWVFTPDTYNRCWLGRASP
jgi:hypothetical protein